MELVEQMEFTWLRKKPPTNISLVITCAERGVEELLAPITVTRMGLILLPISSDPADYYVGVFMCPGCKDMHWGEVVVHPALAETILDQNGAGRLKGVG